LVRRLSQDEILNLSSTGVQIRTRDLDLPFYNMNIDAIAMPCPICEEAMKKMDELTSDHIDLFSEHLKKSHGMSV
jgi:hypothetical protein